MSNTVQLGLYHWYTRYRCTLFLFCTCQYSQLSLQDTWDLPEPDYAGDISELLQRIHLGHAVGYGFIVTH